MFQAKDKIGSLKNPAHATSADKSLLFPVPQDIATNLSGQTFLIPKEPQEFNSLQFQQNISQREPGTINKKNCEEEKKANDPERQSE